MRAAGKWSGRQSGTMLVLGVCVLSYLSLGIGSVETSYGNVWNAILEKITIGQLGADLEERLGVVIWEIRIPRLLGALLVGAGLSAAGCCLQGLLRNGLADPGLIGVSGGGAVGAVLAIHLFSASALLGGLEVPLCAMAGATLATFWVYRLANIGGRTHVSTLLLGGLAINAMAGATVGLILYLSNAEALRRFTFWTLGSLHTVGWNEIRLMVPLTLFPLILLLRQRRALNAFALGEAEAYHLGFATQRIKRTIIILCAVMVGCSVAFCGLIGFVGLIVPHVARLIWGPDYRRLIPAATLLGGLLMMGADLLARTANAPSEVPVGILTALIGAPFFLGLIQQRKRTLGI